jgi:ribonuclease HII
MSTSVAGLKTAPGFVLVDGNKVLQHRFMERCPVRLSDFARQVPSDLKNAAAVVKGDAKSYAIAAASIIAKVTRDRIMAAEHKKYPVSLDAQCSWRRAAAGRASSEVCAHA